jgi:hypothetical protein
MSVSRLVRLASLCVPLVVASLASRGEAQRRVASPPPAILSVTPDAGHRLVVSIEASEPLDLAADRRFLRVDIRDARGRRAMCVSGVRPRSEVRVQHLETGQRWSEWLDIRELCWGRSLSALAGARSVSFQFDAGRARGAWVTRTTRGTTRSLAPLVSSWRPPAPQAQNAESPLVVSLAPADAMRGGRPTLRVRVAARAGTTARAYLRAESVSFRVTTPTGGSFTCELPPFEGRALPDFFSRLSSRAARVFGLDGVAYCGRFEEPGIYEVTPVITLTESGDAWRLRALTGTFVGTPSPLRIRSATHVEQPVAGRR